MSSLRYLLALVVILAFSLSLSSVSADPLTGCSAVNIGAFSVMAAAGPNGTDLEGTTRVAQINGSYPVQQYTYTMPVAYQNPNIFISVILPVGVVNNTNGTIGLQFTIALNGLYKLAPGGAQQLFSPDPNSGRSDVEFFNWAFSVATPRVNILTLNVSEVITIGLDITTCHYIYNITFINPAGTGVVGDPQFVGLRGQSFQVHGVDGAVYNLITDKSMQLNSRFTFLEGPRPCPVMPSTGKISAACWSHPGSYLSELALKTVGGSQLLIVSGDAATGFTSITLNGKTLAEGSSAQLNFGETGLTGSISVDNSHEVTLQAGHFNIVIENNDDFVNLRSVSVPATSWPKLASHGLLGQTWQNKRYGGKIKEIEGNVDDYLVEDDDMFGDAFVYNKFQ